MGPLWVVVTQLGDVWFVLVLLSTLYLSGGRIPGVERPIGREAVAHVMALGIGVLGLTYALKVLLEIPRPPGAAMPADPEWLSGALLDFYRDAASEDGYDVPSGHAAGAVAVYGGLALAFRGSRRAPMIAAALAGVVGASRVAIGVHSVSAVVIGVLVGGVYLGLVTAVTDGGRRVGRAFGVAVIMALCALATGGLGHEVAVALGLAAGGAIGWHLTGERIPRGLEGQRRDGLMIGVGLTMIGGAFVLSLNMASFVASLLLSAFAALLLLTLPLLWRGGIARPGPGT